MTISIRWKFLMAMIGMMVSLLIILTYLQIDTQKEMLEEELNIRVVLMKKNLFERAHSQLESINRQVHNALATANFLRLINLSKEAVAAHNELKYIIVMDKKSKAVIHTLHPGLLESQLIEKEDRFAISKNIIIINEFNKNGVAYAEFIAPITLGSLPWGVLRLGYSLEELNREIAASHYRITVRTREMVVRAILTTFAFVLLGSVIMLVLSAKLSKPLVILTESAQQLAKGDFSAVAHLELNSRDEIGVLATTFVYMAKELQGSYERLEEYSKTLEQKVQERTADLKTTYKELEDSQEQLIHSEKMAALGQLIAGVAHEINTPLGAIQSSIGSISDSLEYTVAQLPVLFDLLSAQDRLLFTAMTQQLSAHQVVVSSKEKRMLKKRLQAYLNQHKIADSRKCADYFANFGQIEAIEPFLSLAKHSEQALIFATGNRLSNIQRGIRNITIAVGRASKVVFALKKFARYDQLNEKTQTDIKDSIETVITIYQNQIKQGFELVRNYETLPKIFCFADELHQVWTNLIHNALQAMETGGTLTISTAVAQKYIVVSIADTGKGIAKAHSERIFQPFFTTKAAGEGSGLGLDIVKKIMDKHQGQISFESELGAGAIFMVRLPIS